MYKHYLYLVTNDLYMSPTVYQYLHISHLFQSLAKSASDFHTDFIQIRYVYNDINTLRLLKALFYPGDLNITECTEEFVKFIICMILVVLKAQVSLHLGKIYG